MDANELDAQYDSIRESAHFNGGWARPISIATSPSGAPRCGSGRVQVRSDARRPAACVGIALCAPATRCWRLAPMTVIA
jgi:hypothetical protein